MSCAESAVRLKSAIRTALQVRLHERWSLPVNIHQAPRCVIVVARRQRTQLDAPGFGRCGWLWFFAAFQCQVSQLHQKGMPCRALMRPQGVKAQVFASRKSGQYLR